MAKILHLRGEFSENSAVESQSTPVAPHREPLSGEGLGQPLRHRDQPLPLIGVLVWCGALLFMLGGMAIMLVTLGEITRRLTALGDRNSSFVSEDR
jgi:hypothetical protein